MPEVRENIPDPGATADGVIEEGRLPTECEVWEQEAAKKTCENTVPTMNEFLQRLVTLETALIGGGFLLIKGDVLERGWATAVLFVLLVSLTFAVYGLMPVAGYFHPFRGNVDDYPRFESKVIRRKAYCMWVSGVALLVALLIATAGAAFNPTVTAPSEPPPPSSRFQTAPSLSSSSSVPSRP